MEKALSGAAAVAPPTQHWAAAFARAEKQTWAQKLSRTFASLLPSSSAAPTASSNASSSGSSVVSDKGVGAGSASSNINATGTTTGTRAPTHARVSELATGATRRRSRYHSMTLQDTWSDNDSDNEGGVVGNERRALVVPSPKLSAAENMAAGLGHPAARLDSPRLFGKENEGLLRERKLSITESVQALNRANGASVRLSDSPRLRNASSSSFITTNTPHSIVRSDATSCLLLEPEQLIFDPALGITTLPKNPSAEAKAAAAHAKAANKKAQAAMDEGVRFSRARVPSRIDEDEAHVDEDDGVRRNRARIPSRFTDDDDDDDEGSISRKLSAIERLKMNRPQAAGLRIDTSDITLGRDPKCC